MLIKIKLTILYFMKNFENIKNKNISFSSCETWGAKCCSGLYGSNFSQILLEDFEKVYKNFLILFSFGDLGYLKASLILNKEYEMCKYIVDSKCSIYENRPSVCRTYPLSPNIDNDIYIDESCPALEVGDNFIKDGLINKNIDKKIFVSYQDKFIETHFYLEQFKKEDFEFVLHIKGVDFYKYIKESEDQYIKMHIESLKYL